MKKFLASITLCAIIVIALTALHLKFWATTFLLIAIIWNIYYIRKTGAVKNFYRYLRYFVPSWLTRFLFSFYAVILVALAYFLWKYDGVILHSTAIGILIITHILAFLGGKFDKKFNEAPPESRRYISVFGIRIKQ